MPDRDRRHGLAFHRFGDGGSPDDPGRVSTAHSREQNMGGQLTARVGRAQVERLGHRATFAVALPGDDGLAGLGGDGIAGIDDRRDCWPTFDQACIRSFRITLYLSV
jgi:hypothetical protein